MVGRLIGQMNSRLPDFVIGSVAGPSALGLFRVASQASISSFNRLLSRCIRQRSLPLRASRTARQSREPTRDLRRSARLFSCLHFSAWPQLLNFIRLCFGEKWSGSAWIMAALCLAVFYRVLFQFFQPAMQAIGKPQRSIGPKANRLAIGAVARDPAALSPSAGRSGRRHHTSLLVDAGDITENCPRRAWPAAIPPFGRHRSSCAVLARDVRRCVVLRLTWLADWPAPARLAVSVATGAMVYAGLLLVFCTCVPRRRPGQRSVWSAQAPAAPHRAGAGSCWSSRPIPLGRRSGSTRLRCGRGVFAKQRDVGLDLPGRPPSDWACKVSTRRYLTVQMTMKYKCT